MKNRTVVALFLSWSVVLSAQDITFKRKGQVVATLSIQQIMEKVQPENLAVTELHDGTKATYRGVPLLTLLKKVYGGDLQGVDEVLFTCLDGYQPSIPLEKFRKHRSLLAFEKVSGDFKFIDKGDHNKEVLYGPTYVVWDNIKDAELKAEGNEDWPYQVTSVDLIAFSDRFPAIAPPKGSSAAVLSGFIAYRKQCFQCHTINGEGGMKIPVELNYPVNVTEYFNEKWLAKWISDPTKVRYNATMPQITPGIPNRDRMIQNIIAYLKAMAKSKKPPAEKK